jgi:hypothetical protein
MGTTLLDYGLSGSDPISQSLRYLEDRAMGKESSRPRRVAPRVSSRKHPSVPGLANFAAGEINGRGSIRDISTSGAAITEATERLATGTKVELLFLQPGSERKLRAIGEVVRETPGGFAVRFQRIERELEQLVLVAVKDGKGGSS